MSVVKKAKRFRWLKVSAAFSAAVFVGIQFVPANHENPPVQSEVEWDSPRTQELFARACADCHSNTSKWPWYSRVAPVSWWVAKHVEEGRVSFNISEPHAQGGANSIEAIESGGMPLKSYLYLHPEARLTAAEKEELVNGLRETFVYGAN